MGLIEVNAVSKKYIQEESEFRALEHVSLSVEKGELSVFWDQAAVERPRF